MVCVSCRSLSVMFSCALSLYESKILDTQQRFQIQLLKEKRKKKHVGGKKEKEKVCWTLALHAFQYSIPTHWANLTHRSAKRVCLSIIVLPSQGSDLSVILRGLNKGQKKEIYFCNKAKIFSSFLLILMQVLHHAK